MDSFTITVGKVRTTGESFSILSGRVEGEFFDQTFKLFAGPFYQGQRLIVAGEQHDDPKWGDQFVCTFVALATPRDANELRDFVQSLDGWRQSHVSAVIETFADETIATIDATPFKLLDVPGITDPMIDELTDAWQRGQGLAPIFAQLGEWSISQALSERLVKHYRAATLDVLTENPYAPIIDVNYFTWKTAEAVARCLEIPAGDPRRVKAGMAEAVRRGTIQDGHTWMWQGAAVMSASQLLGIDDETISDLLDDDDESGLIVREDDHVYPAGAHHAECLIAHELAKRLSRAPLVHPDTLDALTKPPVLSEEQWSGVLMAFTNTVSVLTGGPGVGKTITIGGVIEAAAALRLPVTLMAPTGKAARRMTEATGHPASTIHKKLGLVPGIIGVGAKVDLLRGVVVIDECSMVDNATAASLLTGIAADAHIVLVGDPDQLPSVGPGAVLRDILASDLLTRVHLTKVFRNDAGVAINAARIRAGDTITHLDDCQIRPAATPEAARRLVLDLVRHEIPAMGYDLADLLVLCPTNDGESGRHKLNTDLQQHYNGRRAGMGLELKADGKPYELRVSDRVIFTKNHTELGVANGETGIVTAVNAPKAITIDVEGRELVLTGEDRYIVQLAYAITVHKSQGSEAPVVIIPVFQSRILSRELLYTAITRARARVYLVGDEGAMQACLNVIRVEERRTGLQARLADAVTPYAPASKTSSPFAVSFDSDVYHTRRAALPWRTSCGRDLRADGWESIGNPDVRPCIRCQSSTGATLRAFPAQSEQVELEAVAG